jgi:hypothetical protein
VSLLVLAHAAESAKKGRDKVRLIPLFLFSDDADWFKTTADSLGLMAAETARRAALGSHSTALAKKPYAWHIFPRLPGKTYSLEIISLIPFEARAYFSQASARHSVRPAVVGWFLA